MMNLSDDCLERFAVNDVIKNAKADLDTGQAIIVLANVHCNVLARVQLKFAKKAEELGILDQIIINKIGNDIVGETTLYVSNLLLAAVQYEIRGAGTAAAQLSRKRGLHHIYPANHTNQ